VNFERYPRIIYEKKEKKSSFWFGFILFITGLFLTLISLNIYKPSVVPNELRMMSLNKKTNVLLLGCDEIFPELEKGKLLWKGRSDTIIFL